VGARRREMTGVYLLDRSISHENADLAEAAAIEAVAPTKCAASRPWRGQPGQALSLNRDWAPAYT
jgi:hypothetical protein